MEDKKFLNKDIFYDLLSNPTRENFRELMQNHFGEQNYIDFKEKWIEKDKLVKEMISFANYGGGIIIFGVKENENNSFEVVGLEKLKPKDQINNDIKNLISTNLKYEILDFEYKSSEYKELENKNFQVLAIEDNPKGLPFMAEKDSTNLKANVIYIRRGTSCEQASKEEINEIIERRINYTYPTTGRPLSIDEHLEQLKSLYTNINQKINISIFSRLNISLPFNQENKYYPEESYDEFISKMIFQKKKKIERILDLY